MRHLAALMFLTACSNDPAFSPCDPDAPDPCPPGYGCNDRVSLDAVPHCTPHCTTAVDCEGIGGVVSWARVACDSGAECPRGEPGCECRFGVGNGPLEMCTAHAECPTLRFGTDYCIAGQCGLESTLVCHRSVCSVLCIYDSDCGDAACVDGYCGVER
jgi:hypothetical protein